MTTSRVGTHGRPEIRSACFLAFAACLSALALFHARDFYHDDAYITLRYANRLLSGKGLTWNDGERVEGFTNPLWLGQVTVLGWSGLDLVDATRVLAIAYFAALLLLWQRTGASRLSAVLLATNPGLILWTLGGLETTSFSFWLVLAWRLTGNHDRATSWSSLFGGLAMAAAGLTRPEGIGIGVIAIGATFFAGRARNALTAFIAFLVPATAYEIFRVAYFGDWIPNTARVKIDGFPLTLQLIGGLRYLDSTLWHWLPGVAAGVLAVALVPKVRAGYAMLLALPVLTSIIMGGGDHMPGARLTVPISTLCILGAGICHRAAPRSRRFALTALICLAVLSQYWICLTATISRDGAAAVGAPIGKYLNKVLPPGTSVALATAGSTPYFAPSLRFIDTLGLNDREIATQVITSMITEGQQAAGHRKGDAASILNRRPDLIVLGPSYGTRGLDSRRWFLSDYELLQSPRFREHYRPYLFMVPVTPYEAASPAVSALLLPGGLHMRFVAYCRLDSDAHPSFERLGTRIRAPWES